MCRLLLSNLGYKTNISTTSSNDNLRRVKSFQRLKKGLYNNIDPFSDLKLVAYSLNHSFKPF